MYVDNRSRRGNYQPVARKKASLFRKTRATSITGLVAAGLVVLVIASWLLFTQNRKNTPHAVATRTTTARSAQTTPAAFNTKQFPLDAASSQWVVVNKKHELKPAEYTPNDLVIPTIPLRSNITGDERYVSNTMAPALQRMVADASTQGVHLNLQSGYRSYNFQVSLFASYVKQQGLAAANAQSAHAGYSEHQTGLAADLGGTSDPACNVAQCFATTSEGIWLAAHAYEYGFIIRYPSDKQPVTGYEYEPWHVRYVGIELSTQMHKTSVETLEEFFGLGSAPDY